MSETHCCVRGKHRETVSCYLNTSATQEPYLGLVAVGEPAGLHLAIPLDSAAARTLGETLIAASRPLSEAESAWRAAQQAADR